MFFFAHSSASSGDTPQLVLQVERISTIEKPSPANWTWKASLMAFLVRRMPGTSSTACRVT